MAERILIRRGGSRVKKRLEPRPRILILLPDRRRGGKVVRAIEENGGWVVGMRTAPAKATERCVSGG